MVARPARGSQRRPPPIRSRGVGQPIGTNVLAVVAAVLCLIVASVAHAHPAVDAARARYAAGDFAGTIAALDAAGERDDLTRADLIASLELRALALRALGDDPGLERALTAIASFEPQHRFGPEVPPALVARFAQIRDRLGGPVRVVGEARVEADGASVGVEVGRDPASLTRTVRIHVRPDGGAWRIEEGTSVQLDGAVGRLEWWAEAIGPGGAVIATAGSAGDPRTASAALAGRTPLAIAPASDEDGGGGAELWIALGAGAVVAGVVVIVLLASAGGSEGTAVDGPFVMGFP